METLLGSHESSEDIPSLPQPVSNSGQVSGGISPSVSVPKKVGTPEKNLCGKY